MKMKSFYTHYDTSCSKKLQNDDIDDVINPSNMSDMPQNFSSDSNVSRKKERKKEISLPLSTLQ